MSGYQVFMTLANLLGVTAGLTDRGNSLRETVSFTLASGGFRLGSGPGSLTTCVRRLPTRIKMRFQAMAALRRALDGETRPAGDGE